MTINSTLTLISYFSESFSASYGLEIGVATTLALTAGLCYALWTKKSPQGSPNPVVPIPSPMPPIANSILEVRSPPPAPVALPSIKPSLEEIRCNWVIIPPQKEDAEFETLEALSYSIQAKMKTEQEKLKSKAQIEKRIIKLSTKYRKIISELACIRKLSPSQDKKYIEIIYEDTRWINTNRVQSPDLNSLMGQALNTLTTLEENSFINSF